MLPYVVLCAGQPVAAFASEHDARQWVRSRRVPELYRIEVRR